MFDDGPTDSVELDCQLGGSVPLCVKFSEPLCDGSVALDGSVGSELQFDWSG